MFETELTRLLGIQHPILLAPMGGAAGGALARAVTEAGGLGLIGVGYQDAEFIEEQFRVARPARVGIGFITWDLAKDEARLERALAFGPPVVSFSFGDAAPYVARLRAAGARLVMQVQSVADAKRAADLGADIVIAQGTEAGGHGASRALFPLLPAVVDAVGPIPVLAAGGIADGRGLLAALSLGASGVLIGSRFLAASESLASAAAKAKVIQSSGDSTVRTRVFDVVRRIDWPAPYTGRALVNDFTRQWHGRESELTSALGSEGPRYVAASEQQQLDTALVWAGEGVDLIKKVEPAADIVEQIISQARDSLAQVQALAVPAAAPRAD